MADWATVGLFGLGAVISFLTARYWVIQSTALQNTDKLAKEHKELVDRVVELEARERLTRQALRRRGIHINIKL